MITSRYYIFPQLLSLLIQLALCAVSAQQNGKHNIPLGSSLSTHSRNSKWVSPSGEFAFGLYPIPPKRYLLAIWFDGIPDKTLVWTANRDHPVDEGSTVELTTGGELILYDSGRAQRWSGNWSTHGVVAAAAMLNNGNFVALSTSSGRLWQSFDSPTDTLLQGQTLQWKSWLISNAAQGNYSSGRFELELNSNGNLVLYPVERKNVLGDAKGQYWSSNTGNPNEDYPMTLYLGADGVLSLINGTNITVTNLTDTANLGTGQLLFRVALDSDGILREYFRDKNGSNSWSLHWQSGSDPCRVSSACGYNGYCTLINGTQPKCLCPPGFHYVDIRDPFQGCYPNVSASCGAPSRMVELQNTDWPQGDYSLREGMNEDECTQSCKDDCGCSVVIYNSGNCWKKRIPLQDGRQASDITGSAFVKVLDQDSPAPLPPTGKRKSKALFIVAVGLLGLSATLLAAASVLLWYRSKSTATSPNPQGESDRVAEGMKAFGYEELESATGGFRHQLGMGAFGTVYKGLLSDGRPIAVKRLHKVVQEGEREFRTEMAVIGRIHHRNLVQLFGFCDEGSHRLLVYEYMINGSLDTALFQANDFLSWDLRVKIAIGTARGMVYLHEECRTQILHCDIKPQNILLDEAYAAKISDFGLAKLIGTEQTRTFTAARGTPGYAAPEWRRKAAITAKVDVYSYGTMLLEMICCRKNMDIEAPENEIVLSEWVYECFKAGRLLKLVEKQQSEDNRIGLRQLERMVMIGMWCIQEDPALRPSMRKVVQMLEGTVEIAVPPSPTSFISSLQNS